MATRPEETTRDPAFRPLAAVPDDARRPAGGEVGDGHAAGDDAELEVAFRAGDEGALEAAYERFGATVHAFVRRAAGAAVADELTQDVFVAAWTSSARFDPGQGALAGWLVGIARRMVVDVLGERGTRGDVEPVPARAGGPSPAVDVATGIDRLAERVALGECLRSLAPDDRRVVELAVLSDLTHREIAARTGRPVDSVTEEIRGALAAMRRLLGGIDAAS